LIDRGYKSVGLVYRPIPETHYEEMHEGYIKAMQEAGRAIDERYVFQCGAQDRGPAYQWADQLIKQKTELPEALFVTGDNIATGMIKRFTEAGIRVPEDLAVVGFGDEDEPFFVSLTTVAQPAADKGKKAAEYLLDAIEKPEKADRKWFYCFEPELIIRDTSTRLVDS
jgi:DNA-binding LacI/PurR family transcriptional regulator